MTALLVFLGIMLVSLVGITLTASLERRLAWPYVPAADSPPDRLPPPNAYAGWASAAAAEAGFTWIGAFADGKGKLYRLRYDFFRSPTGDVLALVGAGTMASIQVQTTWLYSRLAGGRCLVTFDSQTGAETDLAGLTEGALVENLGFAGQLAAHRARVGAASQACEPFGASDPLADLRAFRQTRVERLALLGYASFLDAGRNAWRYTPKGAMTLAFPPVFHGPAPVLRPGQSGRGRSPAVVSLGRLHAYPSRAISRASPGRGRPRGSLLPPFCRASCRACLR